jgi:hypothetical protein
MKPQAYDEGYSKGGDAIADLARQFMLEPGVRGVERVEAHIDRAETDSRWDDVSMWHRVRFRLLRFRREQAVARRLGCTVAH